MAMHIFVPPFREAKFCGVLSCVFDKLGCAAGEKWLRDTALEGTVSTEGSFSLADVEFHTLLHEIPAITRPSVLNWLQTPGF
jgi:hypothetical protein